MKGGVYYNEEIIRINDRCDNGAFSGSCNWLREEAGGS
jgi:hypothetical protein